MKQIIHLCTAGMLAFVACANAGPMVRVPAGMLEITDQVTTLRVSVSVTEFLIKATEVTQQEYEAVTGSNPSFYRGADRPVENVSWWDAIRYTNLRSEKEGLAPCYELATGKRRPRCDGYRLPTEAEWIRAAGPIGKADQLTQTAHLGSTSTKSLGLFKRELEHGT